MKNHIHLYEKEEQTDKGDVDDMIFRDEDCTISQR